MMKLDYSEIGRRIARRRKVLGLRQLEVSERADISDKYLSCIERATSIPSTEVIMRIAMALEPTPDEFLVGTIRHDTKRWHNTAETLRSLSDGQLRLVDSFIRWVSHEDIP